MTHKECGAREPLPAASSLSRAFHHRTWYKGSKMAMRDFLELAAESSSFHLMGDVLIDDERRGRMTLDAVEMEYFKERRLFWVAWSNAYAKAHHNEDFNVVYLNKKHKEKLTVPEFAEAFGKAFPEDCSHG